MRGETRVWRRIVGIYLVLRLSVDFEYVPGEENSL